MKKIETLTLVLAILFFICLVFGITSLTFLNRTATELDEVEKINQSLEHKVERLQQELGQGTIVGRAFLDCYTMGALDDSDSAATGFKVRLHEVVDRTSTKTTSVIVAEAAVDHTGEYRFSVSPGEYYVEPILLIPGYPPWGSVTWLKDPGNIVIKAGEVCIGATFLVRR